MSRSLDDEKNELKTNVRLYDLSTSILDRACAVFLRRIADLLFTSRRLLDIQTRRSVQAFDH